LKSSKIGTTVLYLNIGLFELLSKWYVHVMDISLIYVQILSFHGHIMTETAYLSSKIIILLNSYPVTKFNEKERWGSSALPPYPSVASHQPKISRALGFLSYRNQ
jgi:hypothetical protein